MNVDALRLVFQEKGKITRYEKNFSQNHGNWLFHLEFAGGEHVTFIGSKSGKMLETSKLLAPVVWDSRKKSETIDLSFDEYVLAMESYLELCKRESAVKKASSSKKSSVHYLNAFRVSSRVQPCATASYIGNSHQPHRPNHGRH